MTIFCTNFEISCVDPSTETVVNPSWPEPEELCVTFTEVGSTFSTGVTGAAGETGAVLERTVEVSLVGVTGETGATGVMVAITVEVSLVGVTGATGVVVPEVPEVSAEEPALVDVVVPATGATNVYAHSWPVCP